MRRFVVLAACLTLVAALGVLQPAEASRLSVRLSMSGRAGCGPPRSMADHVKYRPSRLTTDGPLIK
jgi:hypothetical protein